MVSNLKSLRELKAFDGEKYSLEMHRDEPLKRTCDHKNIQIISGSELRCKCGAGFIGPRILELYKKLTT